MPSVVSAAACRSMGKRTSTTMTVKNQNHWAAVNCRGIKKLLSFISFLCFEYNCSGGIPFTMGDGQMHTANMTLGAQLFHNASELQSRLAAAFPDNLNVDPFPSATEPMSESFDNGILAGKPSGHRGI